MISQKQGVSLGLKFMLLVGISLSVLLGSVFYLVNQRTEAQAREHLKDKAKMMADQIVSVRTFLNKNQKKINSDSKGNFEFKGLNPAAGARLVAEEFAKLRGITPIPLPG